MRFCNTLAALGATALAAAASAGAPVQVFGGGAPGPNFFNPQGVNTGVRVYNNCFSNLNPGATQVEINEVRVNYFRLANALAVDVEFFAVEMTFDGTALNIGNQISLGVVSLPDQGAVAGDFIVSVIPPAPVTLDLELLSNPGLGGYWIAWNEVGGATGTALQGPRTAGAPAIGASINGFGMFNYNGSGIFEAFFGFGANPSRFMVDVFGSLVGGSACVGPTSNFTEPEPCGEDLNGGCNSEPFSPVDFIAQNQIIAGTYWADLGTRDTDWYEFTTTGPTNLNVELYSDGPGVAFLVDATCPANTLAVSGFGCPSALTQECLPAGTYRVVVLMTVFEGFPCFSGAANDYTLVVDAVATECEEVCGNGADCCTISEIPGCSDADCCFTVCQFDPFCCVVAWDFTCTQQAVDFCGLPCPGICELSANDCCVASLDASPGCTDSECCDAVCLLDPFCCDTEWDQVCADQATETCTLCAPPACPFECTGTSEGEPCGEDLNGGCNAKFPAFGEISCDETVCGESWASGGTRDTDWYILDLAEETEITVTVNGQLPMVIGIPNSIDCNTVTELDPFAAAEFCNTASFTVTLPAGQHWVFAAAGVFAGFPCGSGLNGYSLTVDCPSGPTCTPGPDRNGDGCVNGLDIAVILGNWDPTGDLGNGFGPGDADCNGLVNGADLTIVLGNWLTGPNCP